MENVKDVSVEPMDKSNFLKPLRINYTQNGNKRCWEFVKTRDSVACVLLNTSRNKFVFVKQFRPAVYVNAGTKHFPDNTIQNVDWTKLPSKYGITIELCAGIVDSDRRNNEIMKSEVLEECGYNVPLENFIEVISYRNVGYTGSQQTLYYAECTDEMRVSEGGGLENEGELIHVIEMDAAEVREYISPNSNKNLVYPASFLYGIMWYFANKAS